jgi:hypothetical protein
MPWVGFEPSVRASEHSSYLRPRGHCDPYENNADSLYITTDHKNRFSNFVTWLQISKLSWSVNHTQMKNTVRFAVLRLATVKNGIFCDLTPCSLIDVCNVSYQCTAPSSGSKEKSYKQAYTAWPSDYEHGDNTFLRNVRTGPHSITEGSMCSKNSFFTLLFASSVRIIKTTEIFYLSGNFEVLSARLLNAASNTDHHISLHCICRGHVVFVTNKWICTSGETFHHGNMCIYAWAWFGRQADGRWSSGGEAPTRREMNWWPWYKNMTGLLCAITRYSLRIQLQETIARIRCINKNKFTHLCT